MGGYTMNKSIKAINKKNISNSRTQYLNHIRLYKISITVLRFLILMAFIAAWEISTRTGILNPIYIQLTIKKYAQLLLLWLKITAYSFIYGRHFLKHFYFLPYYNCRNGSSNSSLAVERLIRLP